MTKRVRTAVFPVAGMGTRFLPATKSVPKEMLPLVDRPLIQYAIDEARAAGIEQFIMVSARGKTSLEDYFDSHPVLEARLKADGKDELLAEVHDSTLGSGCVSYVRQQDALGLGHAVWCARHLIGDEPFAVILPDDVIGGARPCLQQMVEAYEANGSRGCMIAAMEVPQSKTKSYGVIDIEDDMGRMVSARGLVEKPDPSVAPSNLAVIGRYILTPQVLEDLGQMKRGAGNEIQLTDAIADQIVRGHPVYGYRFEGKRFDCGSKAGYLQATVDFALSRPELAGEFQDYLDTVTATRLAAE